MGKTIFKTDIDLKNNTIKNVGTPVDAGDIVSKGYFETVAPSSSLTISSGTIREVTLTSRVTDSISITDISSCVLLKVVTSGNNYELGGIDFPSGVSGRFLYIYFATGGNKLTLLENNPNTTPESRFLFNQDLTIRDGNSLLLFYDTADMRWRALKSA